MAASANRRKSVCDNSSDSEIFKSETHDIDLLAKGKHESNGVERQHIGKPEVRENYCDVELKDRDTDDRTYSSQDKSGDSDSDSDTDTDSGQDNDSDTDTDSGQDSDSDMADNSDNVIKRVKSRRERFKKKALWQNKTVSESTDAVSDGSPSGYLMTNKRAENLGSGDSLPQSTNSKEESNDGSAFEVIIKEHQSSVLTSGKDEDGDQILDPNGKPLNIRHATAQSSTETGPDATDADVISVSSFSENEDELVESKQYQVKICGNSIFTRVETRKSTYKGKNNTRHYIIKENTCTDIDGKTGLKPLDELLKVNGKSLKNLKRKQVKRIFKKINLDKKTNEVRINLHIRRWVSAEGPMHEKRWTQVKEIIIHLRLVPTTEPNPCSRGDIIPATRRKALRRARSFRVFRSNSTTERDEQLNRGCINIQRSGGVKTCLFQADRQGQFISSKVLKDNCVGLSVITEDISCEFSAEFFSGSDETPKSAFSNTYIFCIRFYLPAENGFLFLSSAISSGSDDLKFVRANDDFQSLRRQQNVDERCFIVRSIADTDLYQSLIFRDRFISYDRTSGKLCLKQISDAHQEAFVQGEENKSARGKDYFEAVEDFKSCWFKRSEVSSGFHKRLGKLIRSYLCGLNVDRHDR